MADEKRENRKQEQNEPYVVRGARMCCSCGTHVKGRSTCRRRMGLISEIRR